MLEPRAFHEKIREEKEREREEKRGEERRGEVIWELTLQHICILCHIGKRWEEKREEEWNRGRPVEWEDPKVERERKRDTLRDRSCLDPFSHSILFSIVQSFLSSSSYQRFILRMDLYAQLNKFEIYDANYTVMQSDYTYKWESFPQSLITVILSDMLSHSRNSMIQEERHFFFRSIGCIPSPSVWVTILDEYSRDSTWRCSTTQPFVSSNDGWLAEPHSTYSIPFSSGTALLQSSPFSDSSDSARFPTVSTLFHWLSLRIS